MGYDYALVHLQYTIPLATVLTLFYRPLCTALDVYKILSLITIAVVSTIPWDDYLIRNQIWTYPEDVIIGPTLFSIPAEEVFFFIVQTYNTTILYLIFNKHTLHPIYLRGGKDVHNGRRLRLWRWFGSILLVAGMFYGAMMVMQWSNGAYMGLILIWALPFLFVLWNLAYQFIIQLPLSGSIAPIILPSCYLWFVDTVALRRGTWVIEPGTKIGIQLWNGLEIEEAVFFLITNVLVVFGLIAFDNALAILYTFPLLFPEVPPLPSPFLLIQALLTPSHAYDSDRIIGIQQALARLRAKSRSFYLASSVFEGRLRIDLILLYSFCRVADDLVDNASSIAEAKHWIVQLAKYLDICYKDVPKKETFKKNFVNKTFPDNSMAALLLLPTSYLSSAPLYELLQGFKMDLNFLSSSNPFPIKDESTLETYGARVAGTVAELCLELVYYHTTKFIPKDQRHEIVRAGGRMGIALQYVNIARDIAVDASNGRVYLPTSWLEELGMGPKDVVRDPGNLQAEILRQQLLDVAMRIFDETNGAIELLPVEARAPMRVVVQSYFEIGRILRTPGYKIKAGRATVPKLRRLRVAWNALQR